MRRFLPFAIITAVLLVAAGGGLLLFRSKDSNTPMKMALGNPGAEPAHIRGGPNAAVTLEEFGDYECAPCGLLAATLLKVEHAYGNRVRVVFRQFPLDMHTYSLTAARAAEAAGLQGRFWEMHDLLYQNALKWSKDSPVLPRRLIRNGARDEMAKAVRPTFAGYAATLGLDVERYARDMESEQVSARIKSDQERGASLGVDRTPVLLVDGVQIPFSTLKEPELLKGVIDAALRGSPPETVPQSPTPGQPQ